MDVLPTFADPDVTLLEGDAWVVLREMETSSVDAIVTSPPYLDMRPEYPSPTFPEFYDIFCQTRRVCTGTLLLNVGRKWSDRLESGWWIQLLALVQSAGWEHRDTMIWIKPNGNPIQGEVLANSHEYIFLFGDGFDPDSVRTEYAPGSVERLGRRWVSSVSVKGDGQERSGPKRQERRGERRSAHPSGARARSYIEVTTGGEKGNKHPAPMPLEVARHLVKLSGGRTILDPFAGSGTTLLAARLEGRRAIGIERSPEYCQMIAERLSQQPLFTERGMSE